MKTALFAIVVTALLSGCATRSIWRPTIEMDNSQKQVIQQAKRAFITVQQTYKDGSGKPSRHCTSLPFAERAASILALGEIMEATSPEAADIIVSIQVEGFEIEGVYKMKNWGGSRQGIVAASEIYGEVTIKSGNMKPISHYISGGCELPYDVSFTEPRPRFEKAFEECRFNNILIELLTQTHGIAALAKGVNHSSPQVREFCAIELGDLKVPEATGLLGKLLQDSDGRVCLTAAGALKASSDPAAISLLIDALERDNSKTKVIVANCLGTRRNTRAVDVLLGQLKGSDEAVSGACAEALGKIGDARAIDPLIEAMENPKVRIEARPALKKITGKDLGDNPSDWKKWRKN